MIARYSRPAMTAIWAAENRFRIWWDIEVFAAEAMGAIGMIPADDAKLILAARDRLTAQGARVLGGGEPKIGAHGKPVLFLHPKDFMGTLIELEQV